MSDQSPNFNITNGDGTKGEKSLCNLLETLILQNNNTVTKFSSYSGKSAAKEEANEWYNQFRPYIPKWDDKKFFDNIKASLTEKALRWFEGALGNEIKSKNDFEKEFIDNFGINKEEKNIELFHLLAKKIDLSEFQDYVFSIRRLISTNSLSLRDVIKIIVEKIPRRYKDKLDSITKWKDLILAAKSIEEDWTYYQTNKNNYQQKRETSSNASYKTNKNNYKCYNCRGNHVISECPFPKKFDKSNNQSFSTHYNNNKHNSSKDQDSSANKRMFSLTIESDNKENSKPRVPISINKSRYLGLIDTGATDSFISKSFSLQMKGKRTACEETIALAQGESKVEEIIHLGVVNMDNGFYEEIDFYVVDDLNENIILGCNAIDLLEIDVNKYLREYFVKNKIKKDEEISNGLSTKKDMYYICLKSAEMKNETSLTVKNDEYIDRLDIGENQQSVEIATFKKLCGKYKDLWSDEPKILKINLDHEIELKENEEFKKCGMYKRDIREHKIISEEIKKLLDKGFIEESNSNILSQVVLIKKKTVLLDFVLITGI